MPRVESRPDLWAAFHAVRQAPLQAASWMTPQCVRDVFVRNASSAPPTHLSRLEDARNNTARRCADLESALLCEKFGFLVGGVAAACGTSLVLGGGGMLMLMPGIGVIALGLWAMYHIGKTIYHDSGQLREAERRVEGLEDEILAVSRQAQILDDGDVFFDAEGPTRRQRYQERFSALWNSFTSALHIA